MVKPLTKTLSTEDWGRLRKLVVDMCFPGCPSCGQGHEEVAELLDLEIPKLGGYDWQLKN